jgi:hypothetical protein
LVLTPDARHSEKEGEKGKNEEGESDDDKWHGKNGDTSSLNN